MSSNQQQLSYENDFKFLATLVSVENEVPKFEISMPENLLLFPKEDQRTLYQLMLSQYESIPVLSGDSNSCSTADNSLAGLKVSLNLMYGKDGYQLSIDGPDAILSSDSKTLFANSIHEALIEIESSKFL